jgi:hypothetical protein
LLTELLGTHERMGHTSCKDDLMVYALCYDLSVWLQEMEDYGSTLSIYEHELLILRQATENICRIEEGWTRSAIKVVFVSSGHPPYRRL